MEVINQQTKRTARLALFLLTGLAATPLFGQQQQSQWKDTGEYELVANGISKETNNQKKLQLLQQWEEKYPDSNFKNNRTQAMLQTYQALGDAAGMKKAAAKLAVDDPSGVYGLVGYQTLNLLTVSMNDKSEQALADGEKAAKGLLEIVDKVPKPEQVAQDAWDKEKLNNQVIAHKTMGWVEWQRKNYTGAEGHFVDALKLNPANGEISSWLGSVILLQRNLDKQAAGLYHFARAAALEGPGALPEAPRKQALAYVDKTYTNFHGSRDGLDEILERAKTEAFPPEGFTIESKAVLQAKDREKLKEENPQLYLWLNLKDNLKGGTGDELIAAMKGTDSGLAAAGISGFKGKLISATPETNPKELQLSIEDGITPDVVLKFDEPLRGKADPGIELEFTGAVESVSKDPFIITFLSDDEKLKGWPVQAAPKKAAPAKKAKKK